MPGIQSIYSLLGPALFIGAIFIGMVLSCMVQLLILRVAMIIPPVRFLVRWVLSASYDK